MSREETIRINRSCLRVQNGDAIIGGYNAGKFPVHHFCYCPQREETARYPIRVLFAGTDTWKGDCFRYRRNSDTFSIELVTEGEFEVEQHQQQYHPGPGQLFFVHLRQDSSMGHTGNAIANKKTVSLSGPQLENLLLPLGLEQIDVLALSDPQKISAQFTAIEQTLSQKEPDSERRAAVIAYDLLLLLSDEVGKADLEPQFSEIRYFIDSHLDQKLDLDSLATHFRLSSSTLLRLFREKQHDTPIHYIIRRKMLTAQQMLRYSELPVKAIAGELGYSNALYFSAEFRKWFGLSPMQYRKNPDKATS